MRTVPPDAHWDRHSSTSTGGCHGPSSNIRALGCHPDLGRQPDRHRADAPRLRARARPSVPGEAAMSTADDRMWTARLRARAARALPPDQILPDRQPAYVASWIYVFGVATLAALVVVLASGTILALEGPQWYHTSAE